MLWCTELDTAENFGLTSIQKPLIAISKCPLLNIHPVIHNMNSARRYIERREMARNFLLLI